MSDSKYGLLLFFGVSSLLTGIGLIFAVVGSARAPDEDVCFGAPNRSSSERIGFRYLVLYLSFLFANSVIALVATVIIRNSTPNESTRERRVALRQKRLNVVRNIFTLVALFFTSFWFRDAQGLGFNCGNRIARNVYYVAWTYFVSLVVGAGLGFEQSKLPGDDDDVAGNDDDATLLQATSVPGEEAQPLMQGYPLTTYGASSQQTASLGTLVEVRRRQHAQALERVHAASRATNSVRPSHLAGVPNVNSKMTFGGTSSLSNLVGASAR